MQIKTMSVYDENCSPGDMLSTKKNRPTSTGSHSSASDESIRSARATKVFGNLVENEESLCYSPSPFIKKKTLGNITNISNSSSAIRTLPFGTIEFTPTKLNKNCVGKKVENSKKNSKIDKENAPRNDGNVKKAKGVSNNKKSVKNTTKGVRAPAKNKNSRGGSNKNKNRSKILPKRKAMRTKFRTTPSMSRVAMASSTQEAINLATESVNKTLNASKVAKVEHIQKVSTEVARLKNEWLTEKEQALDFFTESAKTKRQLLNLRRELSTQHAKAKVDKGRSNLQQRLNEVDDEIQFKSDVFVQHKKTMKENEDNRRRISIEVRSKLRKEKVASEDRMKLDRIEEQHEILTLQWAASRDADEYKKQCDLERRQSFAFRNAESKNQRLEEEERKVQEAKIAQERFEHKMAGERDADEYKIQCAKERRESYAGRNAEGRRQRLEEVERKADEQNAAHELFEFKLAGERDADSYRKKCVEERRESYAFRNAEAHRQRRQEENRKNDELQQHHERFEHKMAGERDGDEYKIKCAKERRDSFALRNTEGRRQREVENEMKVKEKVAAHEQFEFKMAGERDADEYLQRCEKARRESFAFRGRECVDHRRVMDEIRTLAEEKKHESYVLKWAAQNDVKEYLSVEAEKRRISFAFRNAEGKKHRDIDEELRCEELQRAQEREKLRAGDQKDVEAYEKKCAERDRASLCYRGKELQLQHLEVEKQRQKDYECGQEQRALETEARGDVEEYLKDCKKRRRLSLAFRAKERNQHSKWVKQKADEERTKRSQHTKNMALDQRYVELARDKERAEIAINALRHAGCSFSMNPFAPLLE